MHLIDAHRLAAGSLVGGPFGQPGVVAHSCREVNTTDAVAGGCSVANAIGSAFFRHWPSRPQMSYLYRLPLPGPGTNSSHTPDPPSLRIG